MTDHTNDTRVYAVEATRHGVARRSHAAARSPREAAEIWAARLHAKSSPGIYTEKCTVEDVSYTVHVDLTPRVVAQPARVAFLPSLADLLAITTDWARRGGSVEIVPEDGEYIGKPHVTIRLRRADAPQTTHLEWSVRRHHGVSVEHEDDRATMCAGRLQAMLRGIPTTGPADEAPPAAAGEHPFVANWYIYASTTLRMYSVVREDEAAEYVKRAPDHTYLGYLLNGTIEQAGALRDAITSAPDFLPPWDL